MKFENSARIFVNGDLGAESSWHAELRPVIDTEGTSPDYKYHRSYTQNDYLREAALAKAFRGQTTLHEINKVTFVEVS